MYGFHGVAYVHHVAYVRQVALDIYLMFDHIRTIPTTVNPGGCVGRDYYDNNYGLRKSMRAENPGRSFCITIMGHKKIDPYECPDPYAIPVKKN